MAGQSSVFAVKTDAGFYEKASTASLSGRLEKKSSRHVIHQLNRSKFTGYLLLQFQQRKKKVWFREGEIIRIQSNMVPELIGHMMVERNWLTRLRQGLAKLEFRLIGQQRTGYHRRLISAFAFDHHAR